MSQAKDCLPPSLAPRGLSRGQAAAYIGVSPSTFDKLLIEGKMPPAKRIRGRKVWDLRQLDESFSALDDDSSALDNGGENPWDQAA